MSSFKNSQFYQKFLVNDISSSSSSDDVEIRAIYHHCGDGVLEDDGYKAFMNAFCPGAHVRPHSNSYFDSILTSSQHIIASRDHLPDPVTFTTAALGQLRLNTIDEKLFPIPNYSLTPKRDLKGMSFTLSCRLPQNLSLPKL